jgi:hypothetical protein
MSAARWHVVLTHPSMVDREAGPCGRGWRVKGPGRLVRVLLTATVIANLAGRAAPHPAPVAVDRRRVGFSCRLRWPWSLAEIRQMLE